MNIKTNYLDRSEKLLDFNTDLNEYIDNDVFISMIKDGDTYKLLKRAIKNGLFMRNTANHASFNYWLPLSNAGVPAVPRKDRIHELTFFVHDIIHNLLPDCVIDINNTLYKEVYILHRMISEGICLILADMLFLNELEKKGVEYDFKEKNIYQAYDLLKSMSVKELLKANSLFACTGEKDLFDNNESPEVLQYLNWFSPVYISDLKWTQHNFNSKMKKFTANKKWIDNSSFMIPICISKDNCRLLTVSELVIKCKIKEDDSTREKALKIFEYVYENFINFDYSENLTQENLVRKAKTRFYAYQTKIAYDFGLDTNEYWRLSGTEDYSGFDKLYQNDLKGLYEKRMITNEQYEIYKEVYPHHEHMYIPYSAHRVEDVTLMEYSKLLFETL